MCFFLLPLVKQFTMIYLENESYEDLVLLLKEGNLQNKTCFVNGTEVVLYKVFHDPIMNIHRLTFESIEFENQFFIVDPSYDFLHGCRQYLNTLKCKVYSKHINNETFP